MLVRVAALAALGGFLFGYDLGLIGGAMLGISQAFNITSNSTKEAIVGAAKLGAFFGTFIGGVLMLRYGRRIAIACEAVFFVLGPLLMAVSTSPGGLVVGRLLVGLGVGASAIVVPAYLAEIAPADKRGAVVQAYEIMLTLGMLCSGVVDWLLTRTVGPAAWRWMVGLPAVPGALLLVSLVLLPESPRWLVLRGQLDLALATLHSIVQTSSSGSGRTAAEESVITASETQAVAKAEDELLLLWSSVQKEQAATVNVRQQHRQHRTITASAAAADADTQRENLNGRSAQNYQQQHVAASAAYEPPVTLAAAAAARGGFAPAAAPADVFTLDDGTSTGSDNNDDSNGIHSAEATIGQWPTQAPTAAGNGEGYAPSAAAAGGGGGGDAVGYVSPEQSRRTTFSVEDDADTGANRHPHYKQQQHHGPCHAADDSQSEQLLSHTHHDSSNSRRNRSAGQLGRNNAAGAAGSSKSGFTAWIRGWLRGRGSSYTLPGSSSEEATAAAAAASHPQQQQECEPGQEANVFVSLWVMLTDIITVMRGPERSAFAIAASLAVLNQATASTAVINYTPEVLSSVLGVTSQASAILYPAVITVTKCVGVGLSVLVVDVWGRRPLLIYGGAGCGVALLLAGLALAVSSVPLFLACLCLFIFSFSVSWAGLYWVVVSEIFSMGAKSPATSAATSLLFLTGSVVDFVFLSLVSWLGAGAFGLFAAVAVGSAWYVYRNVPETKGRTLVEIQALLAAPAAAAAGGASAAASGGVGRYGRWRGWDWGRTAIPGAAAAAAAAGRDDTVAGGQASELDPLHQQQQDQQQQHQVFVRPIGFSNFDEQTQGAPDHSSSNMDSAENGGGQYWQDWMHQQQQLQSEASQGMSLPLGLQLTAIGGRQGERMTQGGTFH